MAASKDNEPTLAQQIAAVLEEAEVSEAYDRHHAAALRAATKALETLKVWPTATNVEAALMEEIALLRALVCELYRPACAELGPACEDIEAKYSDVIERALQYGGL